MGKYVHVFTVEKLLNKILFKQSDTLTFQLIPSYDFSNTNECITA